MFTRFKVTRVDGSHNIEYTYGNGSYKDPRGGTNSKATLMIDLRDRFKFCDDTYRIDDLALLLKEDFKNKLDQACYKQICTIIKSRPKSKIRIQRVELQFTKLVLYSLLQQKEIDYAYKFRVDFSNPNNPLFSSEFPLYIDDAFLANENVLFVEKQFITKINTRTFRTTCVESPASLEPIVRTLY